MIKRVVFIILLISAGFVPPATSLANNDSICMYVEFHQLVHDLNSQGRAPLQGVSGGFANNIEQTVVNHSNPGRLGCAGQAEYVAEQLRGSFPNWSFNLVSARGFESPILFPHAWVHALGPHGEVIDIDPWMNSFEVRHDDQ